MRYPNRRFLLLVVAALCFVLAAPVAAQATQGGKHAAKRKKKKPKRGPRGPRGPQGLPGSPGANGTNGTNGTNGANGNNGNNGNGNNGNNGNNGTNGTTVILRARGGPVSTTGGGNDVDVHLTNPTWSQPTGESDFVYGSSTITSPATCSGGGTFFGSVFLDGDMSIPIGILSPGPLGTTTTFPVTMILPGTFGSAALYPLIEPDAVTTHTLTVQISDSCTGPDERLTLNSIKLNVMAAR